MKSVISVLILLAYPFFLLPQEVLIPLVKNNYAKVTSYDELSGYLQILDNQSDLLSVSVIGKSVKSRNLYAMMFSSDNNWYNKSKISVLIFAQQHGNEQSGKEGALLLAKELLKPENKYLFDKINLVIVPQLNPDGSEVNERRNTNNMDLNRNHLILTEPETQALHQLFDKYQFEVTMDVHEYSPYGEAWQKFGYRKNADITVGTTTNLNVSEEIRRLSNESYIPFIFKYLGTRGFSSFVYCPGGPPGIDYFRYSTFDINDGRQSLGIQNSVSFIQEGRNGIDNFVENIKHRAEGQMNGMRGLLEYTCLYKDKIDSLVSAERHKLISLSAKQMVSIQSEHVVNGKTLMIPLYSYSTGKDSVFAVQDYRPVVKSLFDVQKPFGYLIPKKNSELIDWVDRQALLKFFYKEYSGFRIEKYTITEIDSIDFEGDIIVNPLVVKPTVVDLISPSDYLFIPTAQLKGNLIVLALEPKSMLGLITYKNFAYILRKGEDFPVLRVVKK